MARPSAWLLALMLLGAFGTVAGLLLRERAAAGRGMPAYSVYSDGRDAPGAAAYVPRELGWTPVAVTRPIQRTDHRGLLVGAEPRGAGALAGEGELSGAEVRALLGWVEAGN